MCCFFIGQKFRKKFPPTPAFYRSSKNTDSASASGGIFYVPPPWTAQVGEKIQGGAAVPPEKTHLGGIVP